MQLSFTGRLAAFSFRYRWYVLAVWVLLLAAAAVAGYGLKDVRTNGGQTRPRSDAPHSQHATAEPYGGWSAAEPALLPSGGPAADHDTEAAEESPSRSMLVALVLVIVLGGLAVVGRPVLLAALAIGPAVAGAVLLGHIAELGIFLTTIMTVIGLAAGIGGSLCMMTRYRRELGRGRARQVAMGIAADSSGRELFLLGPATLVPLAGALMGRNDDLVIIGLGAMLAVLYAAVASLAVLPAILATLGRRIKPHRSWDRRPAATPSPAPGQLVGTPQYASEAALCACGRPRPAVGSPYR